MRRITGILLAAGAAERFGSQKLVALLPSGVPVGVQSVRTLRTVLDDVIVVTRPEDHELLKFLAAESVTPMPCARCVEGMGASLACGIRAAPHADAWVIALADMPFIAVTSIERVVDALQRGAPLAAPEFNGQRGHPVGFAARFGMALQSLEGDHGARALLEQHAGEVWRLPVEDPGVLQDVDVPDDVRAPVTS